MNCYFFCWMVISTCGSGASFFCCVRSDRFLSRNLPFPCLSLMPLFSGNNRKRFLPFLESSMFAFAAPILSVCPLFNYGLRVSLGDSDFDLLELGEHGCHAAVKSIPDQ